MKIVVYICIFFISWKQWFTRKNSHDLDTIITHCTYFIGKASISTPHPLLPHWDRNTVKGSVLEKKRTNIVYGSIVEKDQDR